MKISARDIDHLSVTTSDPEAAATKLTQLGFNLTPEGVEPRCICFQPDRDDIPNYIELLQGDPALVALALNVPELDGEARTHAWETEDGFEIDAGVVVGETADGPLPWFAVKHETPDAFMEPEWIVHPNGALGMMAIHAVADNPKEVAKALKAGWSASIEEIFDGCMMVKAGSVELLIWSPLAYQLEYKALEIMAPGGLPAVVGVAIAVERARPLQALLRANNVPFAVADGDRVLVAPEQTGGLMIEFIPQN
ncbi:MAG: VOC family protein [Reyranella sp.]|nr:VOC family protein [Reyranella sp.]